jgi:hypothetical protein
LLLAYRKDIYERRDPSPTDAPVKSPEHDPKLAEAIVAWRSPPHDPPERSWLGVRNLAKDIQTKWEGKPLSDLGDCGTVKHAFWFDQSATETLACALMDALIAGSNKREAIHSKHEAYRGNLEKAAKVLRECLNKAAEARQNLDDLKKQTPKARKAPRDLEARLVKSHKAFERAERHVELALDAFQKAEKRATKAGLSIGNKLHQAIARDLTKGQEAEVTALTALFHMMELGDRYRRRLIPNAGVYLCWYSQLRDLIDEYPQLAERLDVCPLPAGGFTGDWFVGIHTGSVSVGLGREVLDILCRRSEQHKRFIAGVGLPTRAEFYSPLKADGTPNKNSLVSPRLFAWPGGSHVWLDDLRQIHRGALSRSFIKNYVTFRADLSAVALQLTRLSGSELPGKRKIRKIVGRLARQIRMLNP